MAIRNPGFEDGGTRPGEAAHWTLVTSVASERIAGFGPGPYRAWEDFERWFELLRAFEDGDLALALFDPLAEGYEDFEDAWDNDLYLTVLPSGQVVICPFGGGAGEAFEAGWSNDRFVTSWAAVDSVTGSFDGEPQEDFEEQWSSNQSYVRVWSGVTSASAMFDRGTQNREDFEDDWNTASTI